MEAGILEILIVVLIIVVFFGAKKIPELAKGLGEGISEFKKATNQQIEESQNEEPDTSTEDEEAEKTKSG